MPFGRKLSKHAHPPSRGYRLIVLITGNYRNVSGSFSLWYLRDVEGRKWGFRYLLLWLLAWFYYSGLTSVLGPWPRPPRPLASCFLERPRKSLPCGGFAEATVPYLSRFLPQNNHHLSHSLLLAYNAAITSTDPGSLGLSILLHYLPMFLVRTILYKSQRKQWSAIGTRRKWEKPTPP